MDVIGTVGAVTAAAGTVAVVAGLVLVTAVPDPAVVVIVEMAVVGAVVVGSVVVLGALAAGVVDAGNVSAAAAVDVAAGTVDVPSPPQALKLSNNDRLVYFHRDCVGMNRYLCEFSIATDNKHGRIVVRVMSVTAIAACKLAAKFRLSSATEIWKISASGFFGYDRIM